MSRLDVETKRSEALIVGNEAAFPLKGSLSRSFSARREIRLMCDWHGQPKCNHSEACVITALMFGADLKSYGAHLLVPPNWLCSSQGFDLCPDHAAQLPRFAVSLPRPWCYLASLGLVRDFPLEQMTSPVPVGSALLIYSPPKGSSDKEAYKAFAAGKWTKDNADFSWVTVESLERQCEPSSIVGMVRVAAYSRRESRLVLHTERPLLLAPSRIPVGEFFASTLTTHSQIVALNDQQLAESAEISSLIMSRSADLPP